MNKLVYITNDPMPTGHAYGNQISKLCEAFTDSGIQTELVYLGKRGSNQSTFFDYFSVKNNFTLKPIILFDFLKLEKYIGRLGFYLQKLIFLARLTVLKVDKDSFIYTRQSEIAWLMSMKGFATYYEDHGTTNKRSALFKISLKKVRGIVVINSFIKGEFVKNGISQDKILVVPSGVDISNFDVDISRDEAIERLGLVKDLGLDFVNKKILVYTGNFRTKGVSKGIDEILKALILLNDSNLVFIAVGGSSPEIEFYGQMSRNIGAKNTFFLPRYNQKELALFQKTADVLLMPFPKKAHYEYFMSPVKMFEYMASKRPIVASNLASIKEVLNDANSLLVKADDPRDLAEGIRKILGNKDLAINLAEKAFADVQKYSWPERVKKILTFIKYE